MVENSTILLAASSSQDIEFIGAALRDGGIMNVLQVVLDGSEVLDYLAGHGKYSDRVVYPFPTLVLLELKLPRIDGYQVLKWIRQQPSMQNLRIIVLTDSKRVLDANLAYEMGANSFLLKPQDFHNATEIGKWIRENWLESGAPQDHATPPRV